MSNKLGEIMYERLKGSRSYAHGTPGIQQLLEEAALQSAETGNLDLMRQEELGKFGTKARQAEKERRIQEHPTRMDPRAPRPGQGLALAGQTAVQTVPSALDPLGTLAEKGAQKAGMSKEAAMIAGILAGAVGPGALGKPLKLGAKKGAKKLASGAALDMTRGLRSLPESADDLLRELERTFERGGDEGFDLSKLVEEPVTETPVHRVGVEGERPSREIGSQAILKPTFDEPITTEELDKLETALAERAQRLEKDVETTKAVTSKMRERMAGPTPGGALIEGILDQPIGVRAHGGELALEGGGRYDPGNEPTLLLDPREAGDPAGTAAHELGHHVVHKAGEKAPARQISLEAEREAVAAIHAKKRDMEYADLAKTFNEGKIDREEYLVRSSKIHNKYSPQLKQTGYQERKTTDEMLDFRVKQDMRKLRAAEEELASGDPELRSADALLQALQEGQLRQPYRPPEHPTYQQFMSRVDPSLLSIQHGWDEGMADLIESYTLRPEELTENVRALLDEALQGRVK